MGLKTCLNACFLGTGTTICDKERDKEGYSDSNGNGNSNGDGDDDVTGLLLINS